MLSCVGGQAEAWLSFVGLGDLLAGVGDGSSVLCRCPSGRRSSRALVRRGGDGAERLKRGDWLDTAKAEELVASA